jgi:E3 ubiquitin-protein ligase TRIP12
MPTVYSRSFHREGVFFEVERLAKDELSPTAKSQQREHQQLKEAGGSSRRIADKTPTETATTATSRIHPTKSSVTASTASKSKKVSSVPSDPHDVNVVRARIICIKANLGDDLASEKERLQSSAAANIVKGLNKPDLSIENFRSLIHEVALILTSTEEPLSSFELLQSGLLDRLMELIADPELPVVHARRHALFDELTIGNGENTALLALIKRLQESLSRMESFEVESATSGLEESKGSSLNNLVRQIRLRLVAQEGTDVPRVCKDMVVSVQAIAPLSAINSWLRSRVISITNGGTGTANGLTSMLEAAYASRFDHQNSTSATGTANAATAKSDKHAEESRTHDGGSNKQTSSAGVDATPTRRKSARLRGKGPDDSAAKQSNEKSPLNSTTAQQIERRKQQGLEDDDILGGDDADDHDHAHMDDEGDSDMEDDYDDVIFEDDMGDDMDDDIEHPQEQTVDLSLPEDGSKPEATTPSGTRVATPTNDTSAAESSKAADLPPKLGSYAAAVKAPPSDWHFQFYIGEDELSMTDTVYGALHRTQGVSQAGKPKQSIFWQQPVIKFKKVEGPPPALGIHSQASTALEPGSVSALPPSLPVDSAQATVLRMLRVLHALNTEREDSRIDDQTVVEEAAFINPKLTAKFTRQLEELVIVASNCLPDWAIDLPNHFPFLFPFEARYTYLQSTSFGYSRLVSKWMAQQGPTDSSRRLGMLDALPRVQRSRVRISRHKLLESATRVMELYGSSPGVLEIEYQDEEGTGLGPTLEFYTLVSKAFAERKLGMWRDEDENVSGAYVHHPHGLFPRPLSSTSALQHPPRSDYPLFKSLGTFIGKALLDSRLIDINLNKVFLRAVMGEALPLDCSTLRQVDPSLARTVEKLQLVVIAKQGIETDQALTEDEKAQRINDLRLDGAEISDLGLDFVLPGAHDIELTVCLDLSVH